MATFVNEVVFSKSILIVSIFLYYLFSLTSTDAFLFHPHLQLVEVNLLDNVYMPYDLEKTVYLVQKRSTDNVPPTKKPILNEKKILQKTMTPSISLTKKTIDKLGGLNVTELNITTQPSKLNKEIYKTENVTISSFSSTVSSTSTTTTSSTSDFPDMFPTMPPNIKNVTDDHHIYYNSTFYLEPEKAMFYWVNFDQLPKSQIITHHMLSDSHRRAATVALSFNFPFYGHPLRNITIATGGFLYMGDYMHSWLAATQYVAPLMANFDTSLSSESLVRYFDNGTAFVVEWNAVALQDEKQGGNFTFQVTLLDNGDIIFVYRTIPVSVTQIGDDMHPVKVGLSDAYVIDRLIYFIRRKTIYEYHKISLIKDVISNNTAIYFTALQTCVTFQDCESCMNADIALDCVWCENVKRCSDGLDRQRQDWLQNRCDVEKAHINCSTLSASDTHAVVQPFTDKLPKIPTLFPTSSDDHPAALPLQPKYHEDDMDVVSHKLKVTDEPVGVGGVVTILLIVGIMLGVAAWIGYAYRNPHTSSGQLLIRYRPSQWRFRSGEARYTAASVHM